jgi:hypothetical protein
LTASVVTMGYFREELWYFSTNAKEFSGAGLTDVCELDLHVSALVQQDSRLVVPGHNMNALELQLPVYLRRGLKCTKCNIRIDYIAANM